MSFAINQNFDLKSRVKDFTRQNLTLDDLPVTRDADYPDDYMVAIDGKIYIFNSNNSVDPVTGKWREFKSGVQTLPTASSSVLGCIKIGYTENDRNYPVELNSDGQAYVNVPWVDLNTTYGVVSTSADGLAPKLSGNSDQYLNGAGQYTTPPNTTYNLATTSSNGLLRQLTGNTGQYLNGDGQWTTPPNTTYELSSTENDGLLKQLNGSTTQFMRGDGTWATPYTTATDSTAGLVKTGYQENGKNYPIKLNNGQMYVSVPWTDNNTTYSAGTGISLSGTTFSVKTGYTTDNGARNYKVAADSSGNLYVNVPWQDLNTTYSTATSTTAGLVKIGFAESGKDYPVELNSSGQMFVNVPWTDTNTTYTTATTSKDGLLSAADKQKLDNYQTDIEELQQQIKSLHYPFGANISVSPNLLEVGTSSNSVTVTWSYNNSDKYTIKSQTINDAGVAVGTLKSTQTPSTSSHATITYTLKATTTTGESVTKNTSVTINHASYYGCVAATKTTLTASDITALTKSLKSSKSLSTKFTQDNQKVAYAYPSYFGDLTSCKNSSGFEGLSGYTKSSVTVNGQSYNVYLQNNAATSSDTLTFN